MTILDDFLTIVSIPDAGRQVVQGIIIILLVLVYSREKVTIHGQTCVQPLGQLK